MDAMTVDQVKDISKRDTLGQSDSDRLLLSHNQNDASNDEEGSQEQKQLDVQEEGEDLTPSDAESFESDGSTFPEDDTFNWNRQAANVERLSSDEMRCVGLLVRN